MNRRAFLKMLLALLAAGIVPKGVSMAGPKYGDMLKEFYNGLKDGTLSETRVEDIARAFNELWDRENLYRQWLRADGKIGSSFLDLPVSSVYSNVLEKDTASVLIYPPSGYRNLILIAQGATTDPTLNSLRMRFNGDTGNNYTYQWGMDDNTTHSANQSVSGNHLFLGTWGTSNANGAPGVTIVNIPNYLSTVWKKSYYSQNYVAESNSLQNVGGYWDNTNPIESIEIFHASVNLAAGSSLSLLATL